MITGAEKEGGMFRKKAIKIGSQPRQVGNIWIGCWVKEG
jgi:hypothetical protein